MSLFSAEHLLATPTRQCLDVLIKSHGLDPDVELAKLSDILIAKGATVISSIPTFSLVGAHTAMAELITPYNHVSLTISRRTSDTPTEFKLTVMIDNGIQVIGSFIVSPEYKVETVP